MLDHCIWLNLKLKLSSVILSETWQKPKIRIKEKAGIPALRRQRQASLVYLINCRTARAIQKKKPCFGGKKMEKDSHIEGKALKEAGIIFLLSLHVKVSLYKEKLPSTGQSVSVLSGSWVG